MKFDNKTRFHPVFNGTIWIVYDMVDKREVVECVGRREAIDAALTMNKSVA